MLTATGFLSAAEFFKPSKEPETKDYRKNFLDHFLVYNGILARKGTARLM